MIQFNPDGSLKLREDIAKMKLDSGNRMKNQRCISVKKVLVSDKAPKKCNLLITLSDKFSEQDSFFVEKIYNYFRGNAEVPSRFSKINEKEYEVEIGTCFRRCTDCCSLIAKYRDHLDGNVIEKKEGCTFERREFCYEDYFE